MENSKCFMVYTNSVVGHKVYAPTKEQAIEDYKNGYELDDFEISSEISDVEEIT